MKSTVEMTQLQKKIDDFDLGPIDFKVEPGTITALVGNNGSGKSTLLKLMMNLVKQDMGDINLFGKNVTEEDESWKENVAYQPQTVIGYDAFTGNALKDLVSRWYPNWDNSLFLKMVHLMDIPLTKRFTKLSQGSQQKLILALTIPRNADLLILDEPTSYLDIPSKKLLIDLLVNWIEKDDERAIVIASHQAEDIKKLADYLFIIRDGKMIGNYTKEELTESYRRYWVDEPLPETEIPGEVLRENQTLISNQPGATEQFLHANQIRWTDRTAVELNEIITLLLTKGE